jgi:hypothetical protein
MLFSNHPYFLMIVNFKPERWLACQKGEIEEYFFQKMLFGMPASVHAKIGYQ